MIITQKDLNLMSKILKDEIRQQELLEKEAAKLVEYGEYLIGRLADEKII